MIPYTTRNVIGVLVIKKGEGVVSRRKLMGLMAMGSSLTVLGQGSLIATSFAAVGRVPETDPAAVALKYVEVASTAVRTDKMGVAGSEQICGNCRFYKDSETPDWGGCALFQNRLVAKQGWCTGWVPTG
jgi:hypothetical protein